MRSMTWMEPGALADPLAASDNWIPLLVLFE
jgi:hypothetical protein